MSIFEYDKEWEEKKLREAEYEAGRQDGLESGQIKGIIQVSSQLGLDNAQVISLLCKNMNIDKEKAEQLLIDYEQKVGQKY